MEIQGQRNTDALLEQLLGERHRNKDGSSTLGYHREPPRFGVPRQITNALTQVPHGESGAEGFSDPKRSCNPQIPLTLFHKREGTERLLLLSAPGPVIQGQG